MKGLFKGLRYIGRIFEDEKEPEMQIGEPTDVKHVAHIGWEGPSATTPSWMHEYNSPVAESKGSSNKKPASSGERQRHKGRRKPSTSSNNSPAESPSRVGGSARTSRRSMGKQRENSSTASGSESAGPKQSRHRKSKEPKGGTGGGCEPPLNTGPVKSNEAEISVRAVCPFASIGSSTGR